MSNLNVTFAREKTFGDLIGPGGHRLRFDFAIYDQENHLIALIEHQGQQHYKAYPHLENFGKQQREITDQMKRDYCAEHNIPLREIRYDDDIPTSVRNILQEFNLIHADPVPSPETGRCNDYRESEYPTGETPAEEVPCPSNG